MSNSMYVEDQVETVDVHDEPTITATQTKANNISGLFRNKKTRNIIFVCVASLSVFAVLILLAVNAKPKTEIVPQDFKGTSAGAPPGSLSDDKTAADSPRFNKIEKGVDAVKVAEAEKTGGSAQPSAVNGYEYQPVAPLTKSQQPQSQYAVQNQASTQIDDAYNKQYIEERRNNAANAINRNIGLWDTIQGPKSLNGSVVAVATAATTSVVSTAQRVAGIATGSLGSNGSSAQDGVVIIPSGTMGPIRINTPINSAEIGYPVSATLLAGEYKGAVLTGVFTKNSNDTVKPSFNLMSLPAYGISVPVMAHGFNPDDNTKQGLATSVDRHLIEKYVLQPGAAAFAAIGIAIARPTTVVNLGSGATTATTPPLTGRDAAGVGLGAAAAQFQKDMGLLPIESTISVSAGTLAGVVFDQDVKLTK